MWAGFSRPAFSPFSPEPDSPQVPSTLPRCRGAGSPLRAHFFPILCSHLKHCWLSLTTRRRIRVWWRAFSIISIPLPNLFRQVLAFPHHSVGLCILLSLSSARPASLPPQTCSQGFKAEFLPVPLLAVSAELLLLLIDTASFVSGFDMSIKQMCT